MNNLDRRRFMGTAAGVAAAATQWLGRSARGANPPRERIKVVVAASGYPPE